MKSTSRIVNKRLNPLEFQKEMLMPSKQDGRDDYRKEYNRMLLDKAAEGNGIVQERYITVSVERRSIEEARNFFARVGSDLSANMKKLNSKLYELDNKERLGILHDFFRIGEEDSFRFDFDTVAKRGHSFKDSICPDSIQFHSNYFELSDSKVGRVLFLKDYPAYLEDSFVKELTELNRNLILSIDIQPIPTDKALKEIQNQSLAVETDITRWQNKQNQNNNFSAIPPMQLTDARDTMRSMQWSKEDISRIEGKFDSFCKTVLRNFARDWYRAKRRHHATEVLFSELPDGHLLQPIHNDPICPLEQYLFDDLELPININNDALARALRQLSRRKRQIVLLAYFCDWTDQQIGERFHVVRSTIQSARTKALKEMRELLEKQSET